VGTSMVLGEGCRGPVGKCSCLFKWRHFQAKIFLLYVLTSSFVQNNPKEAHENKVYRGRQM